MVKHVSFALVLSAFSFLGSQAQNIPVGSAAERLLQLGQLSGASGYQASLVNRPQRLQPAQTATDSAIGQLVGTPISVGRNKNFFLGLFPVSLVQQVVTHHPLPQNDGALFPSKGYQVLLSAGVYGKAGPLSFQFKPEYVSSANRPFSTTPGFGATPPGPFRKWYWGQSAVSLSAGPVGVSLSSENLWWGPSIHHSLMLTNQAPGFVHVKLHTVRPLKTPVGSFEFTLLGGRLTSDASQTFDNRFFQFNPFPVEKRYLNAYLLSYQPAFVQGLSIGLIRSLQQYQSDIDLFGGSFFNRYLPVVGKAFSKKNAQDDDAKRIDQVASAFFKWQFPKSRAEVYGEYGFNDYKANGRDLILNLPHAAAYLVGFRKAFPLKDQSYLEAGFELLQQTESPDRLVRNAGNWYVHETIKEGYTHQNQVLGAPYGTNVRTFQVSKQQHTTRTSVTVQQFLRNPEQNAIKWNDWLLGLNRSARLRQFYLDAQVAAIYASNYGWQQGNDKFNFLLRLGTGYYFR